MQYEGSRESAHLQSVVEDICRSCHSKDQEEENEQPDLPIVCSNSLSRVQDCAHQLTCISKEPWQTIACEVQRRNPFTAGREICGDGYGELAMAVLCLQ